MAVPRIGPRALRALQRDAEAAVERDIEQHVRDKMRLKLVAAARDASARFFTRDGVAAPARRR